jgi:hypothetical protein
MRLRTLLVLTAITTSAQAEEKDFLRQGPVITSEQFRDLQRNLGKPQWGTAATARPTSRCSVPLKNLMTATPASNMPTITPDDKSRFTMRYVAPPAPPCEPNERQ